MLAAVDEVVLILKEYCVLSNPAVSLNELVNFWNSSAVTGQKVLPVAPGKTFTPCLKGSVWTF